MKGSLSAALTVLVMVAVAVVLSWWAGAQSLVVLGLPALSCCAILALATQWLAFVPAALARTERFYDLVGGLTYLAVTAFCLVIAARAELISTRHVVVALMVSVWALRLSLFLWRRVHRAGKDARFDNIKVDKARFLVAWSLQGLWVFLTALPAFVMLTDARGAAPVDAWAMIGWSLWLLGWTLEVIADHQKSVFKAKPEHEARWIETGLWAYSQHPNYFGEILLWTGLCISGFGVYAGTQWLVLVSPLFIVLLLTRISGINLLDARAAKRWGEDPSYQAYRGRTSVLIPWFQRD